MVTLSRTLSTISRYSHKILLMTNRPVIFIPFFNLSLLISASSKTSSFFFFNLFSKDIPVPEKISIEISIAYATITAYSNAICKVKSVSLALSDASCKILPNLSFIIFLYNHNASPKLFLLT